MLFLGIGLIVAIICAVIDSSVKRKQQRKAEEIELSFEDVDRMDGHMFEHFVADVLRKNGFRSVSVTKASGDYGVDIVALKEKQKYAFQCKCYQSTLGLKPIQEVYAGAKKYGANYSVVVTNSHFSKNAKNLAHELGVSLWDRETLGEMMWKNKQQGKKEIQVAKDENDTEHPDIEEIKAIAVEEKEKPQIIVSKMEELGMATRIGAGKYIFGEDLPMGKYDLKTISGSGALCIQKNDQKDDEGDYAETYVYLASDAKNGASGYKGLSLPNGWYFTLDGNVVVEISKSKMLEID